MQDQLAEQVAGIGALMEPARRALYLYVAAQPDAVSREQAATAVDLPLHSVKFHLDRLVEEGLLEVEFRRLSGRSGPGAGRPSKLYRRSPLQLSVSLPERRYDLAGDVLAAAIERSVREGTPIDEAVRATAADEGRSIAAAWLAENRSAAGRAPVAGRRRHERLKTTANVLASNGYEPRTSDREICLANCPFDRMATDHNELVCGMNLALIGGVIEGLEVKGLTAEACPQPGFCCVKVRG
ncbi:MAG TPA: helix-turn-helix domain-containing protein [Jiangellaceae bacterium]|nr:helix-turn-helix domain-containing protein [Jiangellaceae bacterium]